MASDSSIRAGSISGEWNAPPTFRGNAGKKKGSVEAAPGEAYINLLMNDDRYYVIKSLHPHMHRQNAMSTNELLCCADVLITDYSSVFFEFLLMDKPIIFFAPDYDIYSQSRGFYLDYPLIKTQKKQMNNQ